MLTKIRMKLSGIDADTISDVLQSYESFLGVMPRYASYTSAIEKSQSLKLAVEDAYNVHVDLSVRCVKTFSDPNTSKRTVILSATNHRMLHHRMLTRSCRHLEKVEVDSRQKGIPKFHFQSRGPRAQRRARGRLRSA